MTKTLILKFKKRNNFEFHSNSDELIHHSTILEEDAVQDSDLNLSQKVK